MSLHDCPTCSCLGENTSEYSFYQRKGHWFGLRTAHVVYLHGSGLFLATVEEQGCKGVATGTTPEKAVEALREKVSTAACPLGGCEHRT